MPQDPTTPGANDAPGVPAASPSLAARITELEIKLSFAEDTLDALNATVFRQQQEIAALVQDLRVLRQQVRSGLSDEQRPLRDELPPHY